MPAIKRTPNKSYLLRLSLFKIMFTLSLQSYGELLMLHHQGASAGQQSKKISQRKLDKISKYV